MDPYLLKTPQRRIPGSLADPLLRRVADANEMDLNAIVESRVVKIVDVPLDAHRVGMLAIDGDC
jgi:hypothetical protein